MREPPQLPTESIRAALRDGYGLPAAQVEFLPLGNDASAFVYRVAAQDGGAYFLKLKRGPLYAAALAVPAYLQARGIRAAVAPLPNRAGALHQGLGDFHLILYPFIPGETGMHRGLSKEQWVEFGGVLKAIHTTPLPDALAHTVDKERFRPAWGETVRRLDALITSQSRAGGFTGAPQRELAAFWLQRQPEIQQLNQRAAGLGQRLRARAPRCVLCHADIHTANLILAPDGRLFIVDWDHPLFAPPERDLMFVTGDPKSETEDWFFQGYGETPLDPLALAYYAYEWVVQEMGDYGARVFLSQEPGEMTQQESVRGFRALFAPGDVVEAAYRAGTRC